MSKLLHYKDCGLDYIYLENGFEVISTDEGEGYAISDADQLHDLIAEIIIKDAPRLRGQEIKFLRSLMDISQASLAGLMGMTRDNIAKYEQGRNDAIPEPSDKLFRYIFSDFKKKNKLLLGMIDRLKEQEEHDCEGEFALKFKRPHREWRFEARAA